MWNIQDSCKKSSLHEGDNVQRLSKLFNLLEDIVCCVAELYSIIQRRGIYYFAHMINIKKQCTHTVAPGSYSYAAILVCCVFTYY